MVVAADFRWPRSGPCGLHLGMDGWLVPTIDTPWNWLQGCSDEHEGSGAG
jgi:hypothetical protein